MSWKLMGTILFCCFFIGLFNLGLILLCGTLSFEFMGKLPINAVNEMIELFQEQVISFQNH